jgi:hypothetical protein
MMIPYLFQERSDLLEHLLHHFYQNSLSIIVKKLLIINSEDYSGAVQTDIEKGQSMILHKLIQKLGPKGNWEENLNATSLLTDLVELKEFYHAIN